MSEWVDGPETVPQGVYAPRHPEPLEKPTMTPAQVQYIRDRLDDWEAVPAMARTVLDRPRNGGWLLWSTEDVATAARHLRVLVEAAAVAYTREPGHPDRAWADCILGNIALIWADRPDYPRATS